MLPTLIASRFTSAAVHIWIVHESNSARLRRRCISSKRTSRGLEEFWPIS